MDFIIGSVVVLASLVVGFLMGRTVIGAPPEMPKAGKVHGYMPTQEEMDEWGGADGRGE